MDVENIKLDVHYLAKTDKPINKIFVGDKIFIKQYYSKYNERYEYTLFLPVNQYVKDFFGLPAMNRTEIFYSLEEVKEYLNGVELEFNVELVNQIINEKQNEIDNLKKIYNL